MALAKDIELNNKVHVTYHRVAQLFADVNKGVTIMVRSYIDRAERLREDGIDIDFAPQDEIYVSRRSYAAPYGDVADVASAYGWLKDNVPAFDGAEDVWEVGDADTGNDA